MCEQIENEMMVSIICLAYNHENFIRHALDGFVKQKTSFPFEVIVHDDASSDDTALIISEYENKYPEIIKPIYQNENQYSKHIGIIKTFILPKAKGKYLAWCEGDDYWCDVNKLQMQVDALEHNSNCSACFTKVAAIDSEGNFTGVFWPGYKDTQVIQKDEYIRYCLNPNDETLAFQLSGFMMRKDVYSDYVSSPPSYKQFFDVGDQPLFLYVGMKGDIYYIDQVASHYQSQNPGSWHNRTASDWPKQIRHLETEINALQAFDEYTAFKYHEDVNEAKKIRKYIEFRIFAKLHDIKTMKEDYLDFYNQLTIQRKITHYIFYYFPHAGNLLKKMYVHLKKLS